MATAPAKTAQRPRSGHESIQGTLSKPVLQFDLNRELKQLHQEESWPAAAGRSSKTLEAIAQPSVRRS